MLSQEDYIVIRTLKKRGVYHKDIAAELGVHPRTVSRALQRGSAPQRERKRRASKLDPYKPEIDRLLAEGVWNGVEFLSLHLTTGSSPNKKPGAYPPPAFSTCSDRWLGTDRCYRNRVYCGVISKRNLKNQILVWCYCQCA